MRIAFFTEGYDPFINGVVTMIKAYRHALKAAGHDVTVFTPENAEGSLQEEGVVRLPSFIWTEKWYPGLRPFSGVEKIFREGNYDVIHSQHPMTTGLAAERLSKKCNVPLVFTFHTLLPNYSSYLPAFKNVGEAALKHIVKRHCARAHTVTVSTLIMKDWLRENGVRTPICLVRPPNKPMTPSPNARERIRAELGIPQDVPVILSAGRIAPEKGVEFLIESIARIPRGTDYRALIVGGGPNELAVRKLAKKKRMNRVIFTGEVPHALMADFYAAADMFAFPSQNDTLGLVLVEAMNSRLPCVAVAVNGPLEVICDGVTGYLTPPEPVAFAEGVSKLLHDRESRVHMGLNGPAWCRRLCAQDLAGELIGAYESAQKYHDTLQLVRQRAAVVASRTEETKRTVRR